MDDNPRNDASRPPMDHRSWPCAECPWRVDADLTQFSDDDIAKLERCDGRPGREADLTAPTMACHRDQPGTKHALRLCAGWLAVVGPHHFSIRMQVMSERLPHHIPAPGDDWPQLYGDLDQLKHARTEALKSHT